MLIIWQLVLDCLDYLHRSVNAYLTEGCFADATARGHWNRPRGAHERPTRRGTRKGTLSSNSPFLPFFHFYHPRTLRCLCSSTDEILFGLFTGDNILFSHVIAGGHEARDSATGSDFCYVLPTTTTSIAVGSECFHSHSASAIFGTVRCLSCFLRLVGSASWSRDENWAVQLGTT